MQKKIILSHTLGEKNLLKVKLKKIYFPTLTSKVCEKFSSSIEIWDGTTYPAVRTHLKDLLTCTEQEKEFDINGFYFKYKAIIGMKEKIFKSTGLMLAAINGLNDMVLAFIEHKADSNIQNEGGYTALHWAAFWGYNEVVISLLKNGVTDLNIKNNIGYTALHVAARKGHNEIVIELLKNGATDVNIKDKIGYTALHVAARKGHNEVVLELLKNGASDVNTKSNKGHTALHWAAGEGHNEVIISLLKDGASDVNIKDDRGNTALHWAAEVGKYEVVKTLLKYGADTGIKNNDGNTAMKEALKHDHDDIFDLLFEKEIEKGKN